MMDTAVCSEGSRDGGCLHFVVAWVVVKIMVPFWVPITYGTYYLGYPNRDHNFDNYPYRGLNN